MSKEMVIPDYLKDMMANSDAPQTADMVSGGVTTPRISLKGKAFRFKEGGEEIDKVKEDLDVIIVGVMPLHGTSKTFYAGKYNPDSSDPPDCSSMNGTNPDSWVSTPVSKLCATCPNNKFGSAISMSGKKSKACRDSRRLYVIRAAELKDDEPKVWLLNVTVSSIKPLNNYSQELNGKGITTPSVVVTRLNFDEDADYPMLVFKCVGPMNEAMAKTALQIASDKSWDIPQSTAKPKEQELIEAPTKDTETVVESAKKATDDVDSILESW